MEPKPIGWTSVVGALAVLAVVFLLGLGAQELLGDSDPPAAAIIPEATIVPFTATPEPAPLFQLPRHCVVVETRTYSNTTGTETTPNAGTETVRREITCDP